jgi:dienelactone hydrolase
MITIHEKGKNGAPYGAVIYIPDHLIGIENQTVVISLHGIGSEDGRNNPGETGSVSDLNYFLKVTGHLPYMLDKGQITPNCIVVCVQAKNGFVEGKNMENLRKWVANRFETEKICLIGLSAGGASVWKALRDTPELFMAFAPIAGAYTHNDKQPTFKSHDKPVWAFNGAEDTIVWATKTIRNMEHAIGWVNSIKDFLLKEMKLEFKNIPNIKSDINLYYGLMTKLWHVHTDFSDASYQLTIFASTDHNSWQKAYKMVFPWFENVTQKGDVEPPVEEERSFGLLSNEELLLSLFAIPLYNDPLAPEITTLDKTKLDNDHRKLVREACIRAYEILKTI